MTNDENPSPAPKSDPPKPQRRANAAATAAAAAFQPPAVALEQRPPPLAARVILHTVVGLVLAFIVWASLAETDRIVVAPGRLVTTKPLIVVQPLETGVIRSLEVTVGAVVREGDLLATLDPTFVKADAKGLKERLDSLSAEAERLRSEIDGASFVAGQDDPIRLFQAQLLAQRQAEYQARLSSLDATIAKLDASIVTNRGMQASLRERLRVSEEILGMREELLRRAVGSQLTVKEARLTVLGIKEQLVAKAGEEHDLENELTRARHERESYIQETRRASADKLLTAIREIDAATQELTKAERRSTLVDLRAPADAVVLEIAQRSVGSVARGGDSLVTLVPLNVPIEVEAEVNAADIGRIRVGDPVRIKLEALPYQQYGHIDGAIRVVTEDVFRPDDDRKRTVYRSRITMERMALRHLPDGFRLIPGMMTSCEVNVGRRAVMTYLLHPVLRVFDESLREP